MQIEQIAQQVAEHLPCYVYDQKAISARCDELAGALRGYDLLYSVKANPLPEIMKTIAAKGCGADAASANEVKLALACGFAPEDIYYSAPGKSREEIDAVIGQCVLIADSLCEIERINKIAGDRGVIEPIGVRINPAFTMDDERALPGKFGIDIEQTEEILVLLKDCENIRLVGLHMHVKSQVLEGEKIARYYEKCFEIAERMSGFDRVELQFLNFGSGIGAVYDAAVDRPVDLAKLSETAAGIFARNSRGLRARLMIETGRFLVCNAGYYLTEIVDIKESRGVKFLVVKNGMNGFVRPAIACLFEKMPSGTLPAGEPLYTSDHAFAVRLLSDESEQETVTVAGNLCTGIDLIAENITLPKAKIGDTVLLTNAGSYAYSLSPLLFSSHDLPKQILVREDGRLIVSPPGSAQ